MKFWSKSNLKNKCRYGYRHGRSSSIASMNGCALHFLIAFYIERKHLLPADVKFTCEKFGLPLLFEEDLRNKFKQWKRDIGDKILKESNIVSIESNDAKDLLYGKPITRVKINDEYGMQGMFDLVVRNKASGRLKVIDWKSGMLPVDPEFENVCNGTLAHLYYGSIPVTSTIYSIATGIYKSFTVNENNIDKCLGIIDDRVQEILVEEIIAGDELPRQPNPYCFYCGCKSDCTQYLDMLSGVPVLSKASTRLEMIKEINRLKVISKACDNEQKAIDKRCKDLMSDNEPVDDGNYEHTLKDNVRYDYDASGLCDVLSEFGCSNEDLAKIIRISKKDLDKLLRKIQMIDGKKLYKAANEVVNTFKEEKSRTKSIARKLKS